MACTVGECKGRGLRRVMLDDGLVVFLLVTKYLTRGNLRQEGSVWVYRWRMQPITGIMGGSKGQESPLVPFAVTGTRVKRKWGGATKPQDPPPGTYFLQKDSTSLRFPKQAHQMKSRCSVRSKQLNLHSNLKGPVYVKSASV